MGYWAVVEGDSITEGATFAQYPELGVSGLTYTQYVNVGSPGSTCAQILSRYSSGVGSNYKATYGVSNNVATIKCGVNDHNTTADSPSTVYNNYVLPWVVLAKASGFKVMVGTLGSFSTEGAAVSGWRDAYNSLIISGALANGYTIFDFASDPNMGCNGCYSNTTYFSDGIHPTSGGQVIYGAIYKAALQSAGFQ